MQRLKTEEQSAIVIEELGKQLVRECNDTKEQRRESASDKSYESIDYK